MMKSQYKMKGFTMGYGARMMARGQQIMDQAQALKENVGPLEAGLYANRGYCATDAMGFSGLVQYGIGALLDWLGI